ncbi:MAG: type IV secretion system DNA-binding domain-containing protein [Candidatus Pacebacteria bacterium]|nr:type IV secretion system DNA-binding domain-containing protein [Candidatus Paceibacterota bacterium]
MDFLPEGVAFNRDITYLAKTNFRAQEQVFGIKRRDRRQHMYVLGKSGSGKSALLGNMIVQNVWNGEGVCVVDPHGELVESILATIPAHRAKDVIYFNPADTDYHVGFNVLQIDDPKYKHLVASGLMGIFTKIWANAWSARMEYILNNAILALADTPGSTLLGIPRLLVDKDYRQVVINNLKDPVIKAFWIHEYENWRDQYRNEAIAPIQNKVGQFLSTSIVRNVVGQAKSTIDMFDMMNSGKIFLVNVSKGRIGEDNSALLGGMLITKLQLAAMERVRIPENDRKDFYLYVDEFQNFVTDSFASILSEARKYRLNLTLAHQYIAQLVTKDSEAVRDAVFGNVGTMIIFRVGAADAEYLEKEFEPEFMIQDMVNLPNYTAYLKLMIDGVTSRPFSAKTLPPFKIPVNSTVANEIVESSRTLYARPRETVEKEINDWSGMLVGLNEEGKFKAVCSSCGKDTLVPFEPEPGRPVYCKECIAKIKSGEMKPIKGQRSRNYENQSFDDLSMLGIEYQPDKVTEPEVAAKPAPRAAAGPKPFAPKPPTKIVIPPAVIAPKSQPEQTTVAEKPSSPSAPTAPTTPKGNGAPLPQTSRPSFTRPPQRERKGPDHDGLQDILKQALGDVFEKNKIQPKETPAAPVVTQTAPAEEKPAGLSLSALKKPDTGIAPATPPKFVSKTASDERVSALQNAIAQATAKNGTPPPQTTQPEPVPPTPSPVIQKAPEPVAPPKPITPPEPIRAVEPPPREASLASAVVQPTTAFTPRPIVQKEEPVSVPVPPPPAPVVPPPSVKIEPPITPPKVEIPTPPPAPTPKEEPKKEEVKKEEPAKAPEEKKEEDAGTKKVREVPEDILRKVLTD